MTDPKHPAQAVPLDVRLIAATKLFEGSLLGTGWTETDAEDGQALIEFAGRACYQSWSRPNPATATNAGYVHHILEVGHFSVLEHAVATLYITGVSRSLTHELIRHRHFSYSQLSQRFVASGGAQYVLPPALEGLDNLAEGLEQIVEATGYFYDELLDGVDEAMQAEQRLTITRRRKAAREAARAILANATETRIVVTGNLRAWRHFITLRATEHADAEMRRLALRVLLRLRAEFPAVFQDFSIETLDDGTVIAKTLTEGH